MSRNLPSPDETARILATRRSRPARPPPPPAGRQLAKFLKALEQRFGPGAGPLNLRWREIVGETLAKRTEPVKLVKQRGGGSVLEIKVDGPAAALVQHQAPEILARVNLYLGTEAVTKLRIVQGPVRAGAATAGPAAVAQARRRKIGPLDAALEAELAQGLAEAPDGALKDALMKLGRAVLRQP
ncbi:MAG TPA: DciA family protein [Caulobacteraceae bacterium]|jgi:hypothetical protein|nr:DciA family protein [Caulobacteraceae bacterium]